MLLHGKMMAMVAAMFGVYVGFAVPAHPDLGMVRQPDGTEVQVRLRGDEWCHWHEDEAGYTVMRESTSGAWVYATLDADGEFSPTALRVGRDDPSRTLVKGLRSSAQMARANKVKSALREEGRMNTATKGTLRNLVILVQFPDLKFKYGASDYERLYNETGYSVSGAQGSVKDYYKEVSYGQLNLESVVAGPVTVSKGYANYGENAFDPEAVKDMVAEALALLDGQGNPSRGVGLGMISVQYKNAQENAALELQITTNHTGTAFVDESEWITVTNWNFAAMTKAQRATVYHRVSGGHLSVKFQGTGRAKSDALSFAPSTSESNTCGQRDQPLMTALVHSL